MNVSDFNYNLPETLIAQTPIVDRSASRLLVVDRKTGEWRHERFRDITKYGLGGIGPAGEARKARGPI